MGIAINTLIHYHQHIQDLPRYPNWNIALRVSGEKPLLTDMPFVQSEAHADVQMRRFNTFIMQFDHTLILFSFQKPSTTLLVFEI